MRTGGVIAAVFAVVAVVVVGYLYLTNRLCVPLKLCYKTSPAAQFLAGGTPKASPKQADINAIATGTVNPNDPAAKFLGPSASRNY